MVYQNPSLNPITYKGGVRADGAEIVPNDAPEIMNLLKELWATGCTKKVAEGVLAADFIWGEDLNKIPGLAEAVKAIQMTNFW